jgi:hypothetical protein
MTIAEQASWYIDRELMRIAMDFPDVEFLKSLTDQEKAQWLVDNNLPVYGQYGIDTMAEIIAILERENESRS